MNTLVIHRTATSIHTSLCASPGRHPIGPGELIGWTDDGWVCAGCAGGGA